MPLTPRSNPKLYTRRCLSVYRAGEADTGSVAELLHAVAEQLAHLETVSVHHLELDTVDDARHSEVALTVYLDVQAGGA